MADVVERLRVVIEADGTGTLSDGTRLSAEEVRKLGDHLDRTGGQLQNFSVLSEKAGQHAMSLGRDIAQGDWQGAAANMGRLALSTGMAEAAGSAFSVTMSAGAVAAVAFGAAIFQANEETKRQANLLLLTGNYAGLVGGQLNQMARDAAAGVNAGVGNVRGTMEALVATGRVTTQSLGEMAKGVELLSRFSGQSREAVTRDFASMADGVTDWAAKRNQALHYLTYEQYKYIESLEKAGQVQEAMRVNTELLNQHLGGDLTRNMGLLERSWTNVRNAASRAWDSMLNVGREETTQDRISKLTEQLNALDNRRNSGRFGQEQRETLRANIQEQIDALQEVARLERRAADDKAQRAQEEEARIAADREKKKREDDGTSTYERLNQQIQRRLELAQAEDSQGARLSASERYRLEGLRQIADVEAKIGPQRAEQLRQVVNETTEILRGNEAREEERKARAALEAAAVKEYQAREREIQTIVSSNEALVLQIESVGKTKGQIEELKAQRLDHAIAMREEQLAAMALFDANSPLLEQTRREIEALKQKRDLTRALGAAEQEDEARRKAIAENKKYAEELRRDLTHALQHAFADGKDPLEAFGAALENTLKVRATRGLAEAIMNPLLKTAEQGSANFFASLFSGGGSEQSIPIDGYHTGGMVGGEATFTRSMGLSAWRGAPRFHGGGIAGDEVPIIARKGEGVFTEGQMKALGGAGGGVAVSVNVINNGAAVNVRQQTRNGGMDIDLFLDPIEAGLADRVGSGSGPLARSIEGRYGVRTQVN